MPRLKVFCATSGFHDSVVAAPSRPAALKAWGAKTDLFSMGVARQVTDPKIVKKAMAHPGEVIRLNRSGGEEAPAPKKAAKRPAAKRPSRAKLNAAEQRLTKLDESQTNEREAIERELKALERKRDELLKRHSKARNSAEAKLDEARERYEAELEDWSG
jgi:chromosome segregation ATPase